MMEIISKNGKKIGKIADSLDENDTVMINGEEIALDDAYNSEEIRNKFNKQFKELKDAK